MHCMLPVRFFRLGQPTAECQKLCSTSSKGLSFLARRHAVAANKSRGPAQRSTENGRLRSNSFASSALARLGCAGVSTVTPPLW
jgi:hypothetical protein